MSTFPVLVEEITADWLGRVLGASVESFTLEPIGTGQIGNCYRLVLVGEGVPERIVVKLPHVDPAVRTLVAGVYRAESRFYRDLVDTVEIRVPACYHVDFEENGDFVLLLEDMDPAVQGDQIAGCTVEQAVDAVTNLAGLHGPRWCDPSLHDIDGLSVPDAEAAAGLVEIYGSATESFLVDIGPLLERPDQDLLRQVPAVLGAWIQARPERFGLVHGDYRIDNMLFPPGGGPGSAAVDWQTLTIGLPARDLAYFVATSLEPEVRREHERDLVATYHAALPDSVRESYSIAQCWDDYAFAMIHVPLTAVLGQVYGTPTERGDRMFSAMVRRASAAMRDLDTISRV